MWKNDESNQVPWKGYAYDKPRTREEIEECVKYVRLELYNKDLPCGPEPIIRRLNELAVKPMPSARTISRILARNDLTYQRTGYYEGEDMEYLNKLFPRAKKDVG